MKRTLWEVNINMKSLQMPGQKLELQGDYVCVKKDLSPLNVMSWPKGHYLHVMSTVFL